MTYYPDLSAYDYSPHAQPMINVGWLGRGHDFPTGTLPGEILDSLLVMADSQSNIMRGLHYCDFCLEESPIVLASPVERGQVELGMGELRAVGADGRLYAAPSLIIHYIKAHAYLPPAEFLEAVRLVNQGRRKR